MGNKIRECNVQFIGEFKKGENSYLIKLIKESK